MKRLRYLPGARRYGELRAALFELGNVAGQDVAVAVEVLARGFDGWDQVDYVQDVIRMWG